MSPEHKTTRRPIDDFDKIAMKADERYDPGLMVFRRAMHQAAEILRDNPNDTDLAEHTLDELNEQWPYHEQKVVISGKLYVSCPEDDFDEGDIPQSWGSKKLDEWGVYYEVADQELYSFGVVDASRDSEATGVTTIVYAYGIDLEDESPVLIAREQDLTHAEYPYCTREAVEARLQLEFPEIYSFINKHIRPYTYDFTRLNDVMKLLVETFPELCTNNHLGSWASSYINTRVMFDKRFSYGFVVNGPIALANSEGKEETYRLKDPFGFEASIVSVAFGKEEKRDVTTAHAMYFVELPLGITSREEAMSCLGVIPAQSVLSIDSRRPIRSVAEQLHEARLEALRPRVLASAKLLLDLEDDISPEADNTEDGVESVMTSRESWEDMESRFKDAVTIVRNLEKNTFFSEEAANEAAAQCLNELAVLLYQNEKISSTMFHVAGHGVSLPKVKVHQTTKEDGVLYMVEVGSSMQQATNAHEIRGTFVSLGTSVTECDDEVYTASVFAIFGYGQERSTTPLLAVENIVSVVAAISQGCVVRLDGSASILPVRLEELRESSDALRAFFAMPGMRKEQHQIARLNAALHAELETDVIKLEKLKILRDIARSIEHPQKGAAVTDALRALLRSRTLVIAGEFIDMEMDAVYAENKLGYCIDIVEYLPGNNEKAPALVVRLQDNKLLLLDTNDRHCLRYVPLNKIRSFKY